MVLALLVVAGSAAGGYALAKVFEPTGHANPAAGDDGLIAFDAARDGQWDIIVVNPDGTGLTNITNDARDQNWPDWSPDGTRLVYVEERGAGASIVVRDMRSGQSTSLAWMAGGVFGPTWSPDGRYIAFATESLFVVPADGSSAPRSVARGYELSSEASWSPDGQRVTFAAFESSADNNHLYVADIDGGGLRELTNGSEYVDQSRWSPTGDWIAFHYDDGKRGGLDLIRPDGSERHSIGGGSLGSYLLNWSPDGARLATERLRWGNFESALAIVGVDGSVDVLPQFEDAWAIAWSPKGDQLVIQAGHFCDGGIFVIEADGTGATRVSSEWDPSPSLDWSTSAGVAPLPGPTATATVTPAPGPTSSSSPKLAEAGWTCGT
jgi:TolB protein